MGRNRWRTMVGTVLLAAAIGFTSACSPQSADGGVPVEENVVTPDGKSVTFQEGGVLELVQERSLSIGKVHEEMHVMEAFDGRYLLLEDTGDGRERFYEYRPEEDRLTCVGEKKTAAIGSGDSLMTNHNEYWWSECPDIDDDLTLRKLDIQKQTIEDVRQDKGHSPFQYYQKIDETHLLFSGATLCTTDEGETYYSYYVDAYDVAQNRRKTIVQVADPGRSKGMPCIDYMDGSIYTLHSESRPGDTSKMEGAYVIPGRVTSHYVRVYDVEGNLKQEYKLPDMTEFENQYNYFFEMHIFDNLIFLSTLNRINVALEILADGTVQQLPWMESGVFLMRKDRVGDDIYLYNYGNTRLVVYNRPTRCFTGYEIDRKLEETSGYKAFISEEGRLQLGQNCPQEQVYKIYGLKSAEERA